MMRKKKKKKLNYTDTETAKLCVVLHLPRTIFNAIKMYNNIVCERSDESLCMCVWGKSLGRHRLVASNKIQLT